MSDQDRFDRDRDLAANKPNETLGDKVNNTLDGVDDPNHGPLDRATPSTATCARIAAGAPGTFGRRLPCPAAHASAEPAQCSLKPRRHRRWNIVGRAGLLRARV